MSASPASNSGRISRTPSASCFAPNPLGTSLGSRYGLFTLPISLGVNMTACPSGFGMMSLDDRSSFPGSTRAPHATGGASILWPRFDHAEQQPAAAPQIQLSPIRSESDLSGRLAPPRVHQVYARQPVQSASVGRKHPQGLRPVVGANFSMAWRARASKGSRQHSIRHRFTHLLEAASNRPPAAVDNFASNLVRRPGVGGCSAVGPREHPSWMPSPADWSGLESGALTPAAYQTAP